MKKVLKISVLLTAFTTVSLIMFLGCGNENPVKSAVEISAPASLASAQSPMDSKIRAVMDVQNKHTQKLMAKQGIVGTATGLDDNGEPVVLVFAKSEKDKEGIPATLDGVPVKIDVTGEFHAFYKDAEPRATKVPSGGSQISHTAIQTPPIKLGTSGGWSYDLANGYCCGGTLGALVTDGTNQYILSNYHVFQADIIAGGNSRIATAGDPVIQPGLIDANCRATNAKAVATLSALSFPASLPNSNVDASIAAVVPGMVSPAGEILEIGKISKATVAAALRQAVKKSGRTTGLTRSTISGLNATISVTYDNECGGGTAFTKTYTGQIVISNSRSKFLNSGDSGSLLVEDVTTNPRAIGLLFAGSSTQAIANPIDSVLQHFGSNFSMVGN
jgi:hypothetical protein